MTFSSNNVSSSSYKLYTYFRSSCSYRVRIALNLKQIKYEAIPINLLKEEQRSEKFLKINSLGLVPALITPEGHCLTQSLAILDYLEEKHPQLHPLLPQNPAAKAEIRAFCQTTACEMQPLQNLRVQQYLKKVLKISEEQKEQWLQHFLHAGLTTLEKTLVLHSGTYSFGGQITLADVCLVPQVFSALRFNINMQTYPRIWHIYQRLQENPAFHAAHPEQQPDYQA